MRRLVTSRYVYMYVYCIWKYLKWRTVVCELSVVVVCELSVVACGLAGPFP